MSTLPRPAAPVSPFAVDDFEERPPGSIPWDVFSAELLSLYEPPLRAKGSWNAMRRTLGNVAALGVTSTAELTTKMVAAFIAARPSTNSPNTVRSLLICLRTACNYAASQRYVRVSPFSIRKNWIRAVQPREKLHHSREDIARVLNLMRAEIERKEAWAQWRARRLYALASTVAYTGLRKMEALQLRVEDIDLESKMIIVRPRVGNRLKTEASAQPVPIADALMPVLVDWLPHLVLPRVDACEANVPMPARNPNGVRDPGWVFPNAYRTGPWVGGLPGYRPHDRMRALGERAGVKDFLFQSLRHSWATHAEYWGMSDAMIQRVLRHSNNRTQWNYRHADADNLRAKVGGIGFGHELAEAEAVAAAAAPTPSPATAPAAPTAPRSWPKLDDDDVREMFRLREAGWPYSALMKRFKVSKSAIHYTLHRVVHKHVPIGGDLP